MEFKPGDVVQLKSGGPSMTIESIEDGTAACVWFEKTQQNKDRFATVLLKPFQRVSMMSVIRG